VTRDSPSTQGDVPGPDPARAPPTKAMLRRGSLVGGSRRGSTLPAKVRQAGAAVPGERCLVHVWSTCHRNRAVRAASSGASFEQVAGAILGKQARVQNPDKDEVPGSGRPPPGGHHLHGLSLELLKLTVNGPVRTL
jgi:hypothetical protein